MIRNKGIRLFCRCCSCCSHQSNTWDIRNHLPGRCLGQRSLKSPLDQCDFIVQTLHSRPLFPQCLNQDSRQLLLKGRHDGRKRFAQSQVAFRQRMAELHSMAATLAESHSQPRITYQSGKTCSDKPSHFSCFLTHNYMSLV